MKTPMRIKKIPRTPASKSTHQDFTPAPKTPSSPAFLDQLAGDVRRLKVQSSPSANSHKPFPHIPSHSAMEELLKGDNSESTYNQEPIPQQPQSLNRNLHHTEFNVNRSIKQPLSSSTPTAASTARAYPVPQQEQEKQQYDHSQHPSQAVPEDNLRESIQRTLQSSTYLLLHHRHLNRHRSSATGSSYDSGYEALFYQFRNKYLAQDNMHHRAPLPPALLTAPNASLIANCDESVLLGDLPATAPLPSLPAVRTKFERWRSRYQSPSLSTDPAEMSLASSSLGRSESPSPTKLPTESPADNISNTPLQADGGVSSEDCRSLLNVYKRKYGGKYSSSSSLIIGKSAPREAVAGETKPNTQSSVSS